MEAINGQIIMYSGGKGPPSLARAQKDRFRLTGPSVIENRQTSTQGATDGLLATTKPASQ